MVKPEKGGGKNEKRNLPISGHVCLGWKLGQGLAN